MFLSNVSEQLGDTFKKWCPSEIDNTIQLDTDNKSHIQLLPYKEIEIFDESELECAVSEKIELEYLVGTCRNDRVQNWLEALYKLHKRQNFALFVSPINHETFVNRTDSVDIPEVVEFKGRYYIHRNGRHRLTIAKCLGIQTAYARVLKVKSSSAEQ